MFVKPKTKWALKRVNYVVLVFWTKKNLFNPIIEKLAILEKKQCAYEECPYLMTHFTHVDET